MGAVLSSTATLKQRGDALFNAGALEEAVKLYTQAEEVDPNDAAHPSNLSAVLYEAGNYLNCIDAVLRAARLLKEDPEMRADLAAPLSSRLAKALCYGVRSGGITGTEYDTRKDEIEDFRKISYDVTNATIKETLDTAWGEWAATEPEMPLLAEKRGESLRALSRLPLFRKPPDHTKEFYPIGTDDLIDLTEGWGSDKPYPVKLQQLSTEQLGRISFLFGGVGDARHAMATLCGLASTFDKAATVARDLVMILLLDQLNHTSDSTARIEIKATLMYVLCGVVMPSCCYNRLQALLKDLQVQLSSPGPKLPSYAHVVSDTVPAILDVLDLNTGALPGISFALQRSMAERGAKRRDAIKQYLLNMPPSELAQLPIVTPGEQD